MGGSRAMLRLAKSDGAMHSHVLWVKISEGLYMWAEALRERYAAMQIAFQRYSVDADPEIGEGIN